MECRKYEAGNRQGCAFKPWQDGSLICCIIFNVMVRETFIVFLIA